VGTPSIVDGFMNPDLLISPDLLNESACVIAIHVDNCCTVAEAVTAKQVAEDPCLVTWPIDASNISATCTALWPMDCELVDCTFSGPPSRLLAKQNGGCTFIDECATHADCVRGLDYSRCCDCGDSYPPSVIAAESCLVAYFPEDPGPMPPIPSDCSAPDCSGISCKQCQMLPKAGCVSAGSYAVCTLVP